MTMFLDCPAYLDSEGALRCGLPAEVRCRFTMRSTDGPLEAAAISCPARHHFNGPIESLTWDRDDKPDPGPAAVTSRLADLGPARDLPSGPVSGIPRPNTAPAYYLGRPASFWITVMGRRHRATTLGRMRCS